jgi:predicted  nucleic acid-binding Zn-ribbon protein
MKSADGRAHFHTKNAGMDSNLQRLIELQKLDDEIRQLEAEVASLPRKIAEIEGQLSSHIRQVETDQNALTENQKSRRRREAEIVALREKISHYKDQSLLVKTNEQYKALLHEITFQETQIRKIEDLILSEMIDSETLEARLKNAQQALAVERQRAQGEIAAAEQRKAEDQAKLQEIRSHRAETQKEVAVNVYEAYERTAKLRKGLAVVPVKDEACGACHVRLRPQAFSELLSNERIITCESCYRILYYAPEPVHTENAG